MEVAEKARAEAIAVEKQKLATQRLATKRSAAVEQVQQRCESLELEKRWIGTGSDFSLTLLVLVPTLICPNSVGDHLELHVAIISYWHNQSLWRKSWWNASSKKFGSYMYWSIGKTYKTLDLAVPHISSSIFVIRREYLGNDCTCSASSERFCWFVTAQGEVWTFCLPDTANKAHNLECWEFWNVNQDFSWSTSVVSYVQ